MATLQELERALVNADKAGDMDAARKLAAVIKRARTEQPSAAIPDTQVQTTLPEKPETSVVDNVVGGAETALALGTGAVGGTAGMIGGTLKGIAEQILSGKFGDMEANKLVQQQAMKGAQAMTYSPRTQAGQEMTQDAAEFVGQFIPPVVPILGATGSVSQGARFAAGQAAQRAAPVAAKAAQAVKQAAQKVLPAQAAPTPGTMGSASASGVDMATLRQAKANELPVPIPLTKGQRTRQTEDVRFEREAAKNPEIGEPIRQRYAEQQTKLRQNLESFIDQSGAQAPEDSFRRVTGLAVDQALRSRAARDKAKIRTLYQEAKKAGEMAEPADLSPLAQYLNENRAGRSSAPILQTLADELEVQGVGTGKLSDGSLSVGTVTLEQAENLRKSINRFVKDNDPNDVRVAADLKALIDRQTEGLGGSMYKRARAEYARYANNYENIALVKSLIGKKRGSTDRAVALEDVLNRSIIDPGTSLDSVRQIRRLLQTEGPSGQQAWKELQGGTVQYIKEQALRNVAPDEFGNRIVSPAQLDRVITQLDKTGKLDFVFGKKGAEQLRTINDVAKDVLTVPPGSVNTSNTASVLAGMLDVAISGSAGVPVPIATGFRFLTKNIKDAKTKARIKQVLADNQE